MYIIVHYLKNKCLQYRRHTWHIEDIPFDFDKKKRQRQVRIQVHVFHVLRGLNLPLKATRVYIHTKYIS